MHASDSLAADSRIPVNVITGFLGSGKTSLLRKLLSNATLADTAVIINELGEIGIDHHLIDYVDESVVLLKNGCICCGIRTDLSEALVTLLSKCQDLKASPLKRVIIETTGMADPVPVLNSLTMDPVLRHHFRVSTVVTTVDAVFGEGQLARHVESVKQVAVADRIVITKADLSDPEQLGALDPLLARLNPTALRTVLSSDTDPAQLMLDRDTFSSARKSEIQGWFATRDVPGESSYHKMTKVRTAESKAGDEQHSKIRTASLVFDHPLNWIVFGAWMSMILHRYGESLLRLKGILNIEGSDRPTVVHGIQHLVHAPIHLDAWPTEDRRSRLILIGDLPAESDLQSSLERFTHWL